MTEKEKTFSRTISFKDVEKNIAKVEIGIKDGQLSMTGEYAGSGGQCQDSIEPKNDAQTQLIKIWNRWHLNDMKAGCVHQREAKWNDILLDETKPKTQDNMATWTHRKDHPKGLLSEPCPVCGYKYGTAWLKEELPEDITEQLTAICDKIEETEADEHEGCCISEMSKEERQELDLPDKVIALALHLDLTDVEAEEDIVEERYNYLTYGGIDYFVGTQEEAEEEAMEYLTDDQELWKMAVDAERTTKGLEEWAQEVIDMDGIGHILNSWDGSEYEEEVNGTSYVICRR